MAFGIVIDDQNGISISDFSALIESINKLGTTAERSAEAIRSFVVECRRTEQAELDKMTEAEQHLYYELRAQEMPIFDALYLAQHWPKSSP
jgi:hypothetical protein